jgi:hypothetical protein
MPIIIKKGVVSLSKVKELLQEITVPKPPPDLKMLCAGVGKPVGPDWVMTPWGAWCPVCGYRSYWNLAARIHIGLSVNCPVMDCTAQLVDPITESKS